MVRHKWNFQLGIINFLFGDKTEIIKEIDDPELGTLIWSSDDESWKGRYSGIDILISYEKGLASPSQEIREYALAVLKDQTFLENALINGKENFVKEWPGYDQEVNALKYSIINFYRYKSRINRIIASLEPGEDYRAWRISFREYNCEGLGFDS
jgi:hypothetical protein